MLLKLSWASDRIWGVPTLAWLAPCTIRSVSHPSRPNQASLSHPQFNEDVMCFSVSFLPRCFPFISSSSIAVTFSFSLLKLVLNTDKVKFARNCRRNRPALWCLVSCKHQNLSCSEGSKNYLSFQPLFFIRFRPKSFL